MKAECEGDDGVWGWFVAGVHGVVFGEVERSNQVDRFFIY